VVYRNRPRARICLDPVNLYFYILRTCNPAEEVTDEVGTKIKGKNEWYYLVLSETVVDTGDKGGDVQILVEGCLSKVKSEVLLQFGEKVQEKLEELNSAEKEREKITRSKRALMGSSRWNSKGKDKGKAIADNLENEG
jgi:hypothetical protein